MENFMWDNRNSLTIDVIRQTYEKLDYKFFSNGDLNLNIFGIRDNNPVANKFDDIIGLAYKLNGDWQLKLYNATTDPGSYYMRDELLDSRGVAILVPGQYRGAYKLGKHRNQYPALVQHKPLPVYRDKNRDDVHDFDPETIVTGMYGINIHRATANAKGKSVQVDKWSAGCQVIAANDDWHEFYKTVMDASKKYGDTFTYTLFTEDQIVV